MTSHNYFTATCMVLTFAFSLWRGEPRHLLLSAGFFASCIGDLFLANRHGRLSFFIGGVAAFSVAHIMFFLYAWQYVRMACYSDRVARRLADWRRCQFLHGVFLRDVGVGQRHEGALAAEGAASGRCVVVDILRCDDCTKQFSRHEAQREIGHSDVCGVPCLHAGIMGGLHGSRSVCQDGVTVVSETR